MTPSTSRATMIILGLGAFALAAFLAFGFWRIGAEESRTQALLTEAEEKAAEEAAFQSLRSLQVTSKADLEAFDQAVFSEDKLVSTIETLEAAGASLGAHVSITSVDKAQSQKKGQDQAGLRLVVEVDGSWKSIYQFLVATENLPYRFVVEEADMLHREGGWEGHFTLLFPTFN